MGKESRVKKRAWKTGVSEGMENRYGKARNTIFKNVFQNGVGYCFLPCANVS